MADAVVTEQLPMQCACGDRKAVLDERVGDASVDGIIYETQWVKFKDTSCSTHLEIASDMWMGVTMVFTAYCDDDDCEEDWHEVRRVRAQCDRLLDGLFAIREYITAHPDGPPPEGAPGDGIPRVTL